MEVVEGFPCGHGGMGSSEGFFLKCGDDGGVWGEVGEEVPKGGDIFFLEDDGGGGCLQGLGGGEDMCDEGESGNGLERFWRGGEESFSFSCGEDDDGKAGDHEGRGISGKRLKGLWSGLSLME